MFPPLQAIRSLIARLFQFILIISFVDGVSITHSIIKIKFHSFLAAPINHSHFFSFSEMKWNELMAAAYCYKIKIKFNWMNWFTIHFGSERNERKGRSELSKSFRSAPASIQLNLILIEERAQPTLERTNQLK